MLVQLQRLELTLLAASLAYKWKIDAPYDARQSEDESRHVTAVAESGKNIAEKVFL